MDSQINSAVKDLIEHEAAQPKPPKDEAPGAFKFNTAKDKVGIPLESVDYVKASCKLCHGRGYLSFLVGDGYLDGAPRKARDLRACTCVHRGYSKTRLAFQKRVLEDVKDFMTGYKGEFPDVEAQRQHERFTKQALVAFGFADQKTILDVQNGR